MKKREKQMAIERQRRKTEFRNEEIAEKIALEGERTKKLKDVQYQMLQTRYLYVIELQIVLFLRLKLLQLIFLPLLSYFFCQNDC